MRSIPSIPPPRRLVGHPPFARSVGVVGKLQLGITSQDDHAVNLAQQLWIHTLRVACGHVGTGLGDDLDGLGVELRAGSRAGGVDLDPVTSVFSGQGCGHLGLAAVADADEEDCRVGAHEVKFSFSDTAVCGDGVEDAGRVGSWGKSFGPSHSMV